MTSPNRYLVSFNARREYHQFTDILIIGAGIAGIRAALEVPAGLDVLVITKDSIRESNSTYAQGGIAGVLSPEDDFQSHIEDTKVAGAGLCDPEIVEQVIREAPEQIADLIRFGTNFDMEDGELALTREGGHSHRRIVHALGDETGHEVMRALIAKARATPNIVLKDETFTLDLLTHRRRLCRSDRLAAELGEIADLGQASDPCFRRLRHGLSRNHQSAGCYRGWHGRCLSCRR